jgi:Ca2+-binding EF-hand superfamily protein
VEAGDAALDSAKTKLMQGDHAGARAELGNARKAFKTAGIEKPELAQLDLDIAAQEQEAEAAAAKVMEEQEALAAREAAAKAAAFKAGAEAAAKAAKEEADAKRAAEDAGRAQAKAAAAAKAREEEEARAATEAAAAEKKAEVERQTAAAAFAEKKRREKEAKEAAAAAQTTLGGKPAATPRQADIEVGDWQESAPAQTASSSWPLTEIEKRPGERVRQPITQRRTRPPSALQIPASPGPREATQDRKGPIRSVKVMAGSPEHQYGASANAAASPTAASLAALQAFELPEPQLWAALLGHLEDADVHSTGVVTEYTASRILKRMELPLSEDAWRHAMSLASVATSPSKSKVVSEPCVQYKELVTELAHMHERAMKQRRIDAVLASVSVQGGNHLSQALRALPTELLQDAAALETLVLSVLGEAPISLPEHLFETAVGLGKTAGGVFSIEKLLNALAKSAVRDPFEHVRTKLLHKYGRLTTAFLAISRLLGASKAAKGGEVAISMDQLRTALSELGGLSMDIIEHVVFLADADGSNSIDYKEFITMFSKRITVVRRRSTVLVPDQHAASKSPHDRPLGSISGQKSLSSQDLEPAEWSMLRQLTESSWSLGDAFRALDADGKGSIPASQLRQRLRDQGTELSFNELQTIIAKVDANNDGIISFAEFVSRYRLQPVVSSREAKSDTVMAMSSKYKSPIQAYQVACGGQAQLTRLRLKAFIRSLGLGLHDATIEQMCTEVDNVSTQSQREDLDESSSTSSATLSDEVSFVDFLRLFRLDSACLSKTGMWTRAKTTFCAGRFANLSRSLLRSIIVGLF